MRTTGLAIILSAFALAACGGDDGVTPIDSGSDSPQVTCSVSSNNFPGLGTITGAAIINTGTNAGSPNDDILEFDALLETAQPSDLLSIQLYGGYGVFAPGGTPGPVTTGTFTISGVETNFATCGVCVAILTNATQSGFEDAYFATGGTVTVTSVGTAVGQTFAASFSGLTLTHVTIDQDTSETTPVGDGCDTAIASGDFSAALQAPN